MPAAFRAMMRTDRERLGPSVAHASWLVGVSVLEYCELEEGERYPTSTRGPDVQASRMATSVRRPPALAFQVALGNTRDSMTPQQKFTLGPC
jgi:hypothetical protein